MKYQWGNSTWGSSSSRFARCKHSDHLSRPPFRTIKSVNILLLIPRVNKRVCLILEMQHISVTENSTRVSSGFEKLVRYKLICIGLFVFWQMHLSELFLGKLYLKHFLKLYRREEHHEKDKKVLKYSYLLFFQWRRAKRIWCWWFPCHKLAKVSFYKKDKTFFVIINGPA